MAAVAVGLQVCCCNLESVFRVCIACGDHSTRDASGHGHHHHGPSNAADDHAHSDAHTLPDGGDHEHDGTCECGSHQTAKSPPEKRGFQAPAPPLLAVLVLTALDDTGPPARARQPSGRCPVYRPPMSLLGQRCALTL